MYTEIFPDPTALFRFKIDLQRLGLVDSVSDVEQWGFESKHQLPPIGLFSESYNPYIAKLAWNPQGLFLQIDLDLSGRNRASSRPYEFRVSLMVNSRFNPNILRANEFCTKFIFSRNLRSRSSPPQLDSSGNELLLCTNQEDTKAILARDIAATEPNFGSVRSSTKGLTFWLHLASPAMNGYRPDEFPDIGLHFDVVAVDPDYQGSPMVWNMVHSYQIAPRNNPSLWTHCRLV